MFDVKQLFPLMLQVMPDAASHANVQVCPILLKAGITADVTELEALFAAAGTTAMVNEDELGETVKALPKLGLDTNARNAKGRTALLLATDGGHLPTARALDFLWLWQLP